jgi:hypothetical protein
MLRNVLKEASLFLAIVAVALIAGFGLLMLAALNGANC